MKFLIAASVAAVVCVALPSVTRAAPVVPFPSAQQAQGERGSIEDVRWVRRCHWVRTWRFGHRVRVQRCERVWFGPPRRGPRYPRY